MKRNFIMLSNSWTPSSFYDSSTSLIWVVSYDTFVKVHEKKIRAPQGKKYAMHEDVYKAFLFMYKNKKTTAKKKRKTRRRCRN